VAEPLLYKVNRQTAYAPVMTRSKAYSLNDAVSYYRQRLLQDLTEDNSPS
jgi:hypothetical protein